MGEVKETLSIPRIIALMMETRRAEVMEASRLAASYLGRTLPHVPGADMGVRMCERLYHGRTIEQAAAREYVYRWSLALIPSPRNAGIFGVPHTLGL